MTIIVVEKKESIKLEQLSNESKALNQIKSNQNLYFNSINLTLDSLTGRL